MRIDLVTNSAADIMEDFIKRYKIEILPACLFYWQSVLPGWYLDFSYRLLPPTVQLTSCPNYRRAPNQEFSKCYQKLFYSGCNYAIGIFTAAKLSSITDTARKTAEDYAGRVSVIKSGSLSMGSGYQVLAASDSIEKGLNLQEVVEKAQSIRKHLKVFATMDTINYLRRSGGYIGKWLH